MSTMTTSDKFPVIDITHKPKRMQGDNIRQAQAEKDRVSQEAMGVSYSSDVPSVVTLERAITYYESHAEGSLKTLYTETAKWLREFMSRSIPAPAVDEVDADKARELLGKVRGK